MGTVTLRRLPFARRQFDGAGASALTGSGLRVPSAHEGCAAVLRPLGSSLLLSARAVKWQCGRVAPRCPAQRHWLAGSKWRRLRADLRQEQEVASWLATWNTVTRKERAWRPALVESATARNQWLLSVWSTLMDARSLALLNSASDSLPSLFVSSFLNSAASVLLALASCSSIEPSWFTSSASNFA